jgi:quercetin dioxygenase-like cupin family protein
MEEGGAMTAAERATAERELAARDRRSDTPPVLRREEVVFERSSRKGLDIATIIGPHRGIEVRSIGLDVYRLRPGAHTEAWRSMEQVLHVLNGRGHAIIGGKRYDFGPHDTLHVQMGAWHQLFNDDPAKPHLEFRATGLVAKHFAKQLQRVDRCVLERDARDCKGTGAVEIRNAEIEIDLELVTGIPRCESGDVEALERRPPVRGSRVAIPRANQAERPLAVVARKQHGLRLKVDQARRRVAVMIGTRDTDGKLQVAREIARRLSPVLVSVVVRMPPGFELTRPGRHDRRIVGDERLPGTQR